jgi:hypothetical protein
MKNMIQTMLIALMILVSCNVNKESREIGRMIEYRSIYNGLRNSNDFERFIGFHIVRRDGGNQFFYNDLKNDSIAWQDPILYSSESEELDEQTKKFFDINPKAKQQFDLMISYGIKAVITNNYNAQTNRLEYRENGGYDFNTYELLILLSDSISISHINFDITEYSYIIKENYDIIENLDATWFVLKRL